MSTLKSPTSEGLPKPHSSVRSHRKTSCEEVLSDGIKDPIYSSDEESPRSISAHYGWRKTELQWRPTRNQQYNFNHKNMKGISEEGRGSPITFGSRTPTNYPSYESNGWKPSICSPYNIEEFRNKLGSRRFMEPPLPQINKINKSSQEHNLAILSEAASMISVLKNDLEEDEIDSPYENMPGIMNSTMWELTATYGYIESPAQKNRFAESTVLKLPRIDIRVQVREFLSASLDIQRAHLIAARIFYQTGYALTVTAASDSALLCRNRKLTWLVDDTITLPLPHLGSKKAFPETMIEDSRHSLMARMSPMFEQMELAVAAERDMLQKGTGLFPYFRPNGSCIYINESNMRSVSASVYAERYSSFIKSTQAREREEFRLASEKAYRSWMQPYQFSKRIKVEQNSFMKPHSVIKDIKEPTPPYQNFCSLSSSVPTVNAVPIAAENKESKHASKSRFVPKTIQIPANRPLLYHGTLDAGNVSVASNFADSKESKHASKSLLSSKRSQLPAHRSSCYPPSLDGGPAIPIRGRQYPRVPSSIKSLSPGQSPSNILCGSISSRGV